MTAISVSEALKTLQSSFGSTLKASRERGRELMRTALENEHGLTESAASGVVAALVESRGVSWVTQTTTVESLGATSPLSERPVASTVQNAPGALPFEGGYWQIGEARSQTR